MVRLPLLFRSKLQALKKRTGTPMTMLIVQALKNYFIRFNLWSSHDDRILAEQADIG